MKRPASYTPAVADEETLGEDRILTIPNLLSLIRLACVPLFLWLLFGRDNRYGAAWLLAGLGATDWVDGYIARRFNQVSTLGKILDPAADRILLGVGVVAILIDGSVPAVARVSPTIVREILVSVARPRPRRDGRPAHRRPVGRQGRHVRADVRLPVVPRGATPTLTGATSPVSSAWVCAIPG